MSGLLFGCEFKSKGTLHNGTNEHPTEHRKQYAVDIFSQNKRLLGGCRLFQTVQDQLPRDQQP